MNRIDITGIILLAAGLRACSQGFVNLNFEGAKVTLPSGTQPGPVLVTNALFGWSIYYGTFPQTQIYYDDMSLGSSQITLAGTNDPYGQSAIEGNFSVLLQGGVTAAGVSIRQTGILPTSTESIFFKAYSLGPMSLSLGGQDIAYVAVGSGPNYTMYGGSIPSSLTGQAEQLVFSVPGGLSGNNVWNIDSIFYSTNPIPEPSTLALAAGGALLLGLARWRK